MRKLSDNVLHAVIAVGIVHLLLSVGSLISSHGHWGWYGSLVLTIWTLVWTASTLSDRSDAAAKATTEALTRFYR
jgi:hypothetical protein